MRVEACEPAVDTEAMPDQRAGARKRRFLLIGLATTMLLCSWALAWVLPAPRSCVSLYCGENFNAQQVPWRVLSFWNWPLLVVVTAGLLAFATLVLLSVRRYPSRSTFPDSRPPGRTLTGPKP
jgi:hypothetical protein